MDIQELRAKKLQLEQAAREKVASITKDTTDDQVRSLYTEHDDLLKQIVALDVEIARAEEVKRAEDKKRAAKDKGDDDDDGDDDEDDEGDKKRGGGGDEKDGSDKDSPGGGKTPGKSPSRKAFAEMALVDKQARDLGVDVGFAQAIEKGENANHLRKRLFAELAKKSESKKVDGGDGGGFLTVTRDEREGVVQAMEIALIRRTLASRGRQAIEYKPKSLQERQAVEHYGKQAEQYMNHGLVDIAAACIDYRPRRAGSRFLTPGDANTIFERAFTSTSDFPNIFQNVLNKSLLARYELHMPTYRELAVERSFNDFRPHPQVRAGEFPQLQPVTETGELRYGASVDNGETISVLPYGVIFTISRIMLVNDDLGAIDQILGSAGDTVLIFENTTFFNMLLSNPTLLQDSLAVFHATHANLGAVTSTPPSITSIGAARQSLRQMKSLSGNFLNVGPAIILGGPATETVIDQMVTSITPTLTTSVNPFSGRLRAVSDANITDNSWYLFSEPGRVPTFVYGFLNGSGGPRVRTFEPFGVQGVKVSLEHDFGCGAIDYRGAYKQVS